MNTEYLKKHKCWKDEDKDSFGRLEDILNETLIAVPRRTTMGLFKEIREFLYEQGFKTPFLYGAEDRTEVKPLPERLHNYIFRFGCVVDALLDSEMMESNKPSRGKGGKALNSRPKIIDDCRQRVEDIKNDLETMKQEYQEWSEKINEGATQDKCNDAVDTLDTTVSELEEIESRLDALQGELPQGFGRD